MFFPIMLEISKKDIKVIGGGEVAFRKCEKLLEFGGKVTVVSPGITKKFESLKSIYKDKLEFIYDSYKEEYLIQSFLVIAATSSKHVNKKIVKTCRDLNILVNSVDGREDSDFLTTSIINNDNLSISICTGGSFPALSKKIRKDMEKKYKKYDKEYMGILEEIRYVIIERNPDNKLQVMDKVLDFDIDELKSFRDKLLYE